MSNPAPRNRPTLVDLKEESLRRLYASERAVERRFNEARLLASLAVALLLVGFLLVAQWRGNATLGSSLERQSDQDLGIIIEELTTENAALRNEIMHLQVRVSEAERETKDRGTLLNEAAREIESLKAISGVVPVSGPGIEVRLEDPERVLLPQDFLALVNELRAGGAEALAVNGVRLTAAAGFSGSDGAITVAGTRLTGPYRLQAIGDPANLEQSLGLPGGLKATLSSFPGVMVRIEQREMIEVAAAEPMRFVVGSPYEE